jgi:hypothetical protein
MPGTARPAAAASSMPSMAALIVFLRGLSSLEDLTCATVCERDGGDGRRLAVGGV